MEKWTVVDESSDRPGYCCLAVRDESNRLIADLPDHPLEATDIVKRTEYEARLIAAAPELLYLLERIVYAYDTKYEPKYADGKLYRETKKEVYATLDRLQWRSDD